MSNYNESKNILHKQITSQKLILFLIYFLFLKTDQFLTLIKNYKFLHHQRTGITSRGLYFCEKAF